ncbi:CpsB/CapC family capsule biosynthesis tyrosine phosphatase, partial [Staphylococcus aureus]|uniref:CpsB/CapC family capsule biosynthesis tyrosine phosphatase n=1 Tax=Staphylococcus aureus TaxID=1280 RepID=UPI0028CB1EBB
MIHIHNHILVHIHDPPKTIQKTIPLLNQPNYQALTTILPTPHHFHPTYHNTFQQLLLKFPHLTTHPQLQPFHIKLFPPQQITITHSILKPLHNPTIQPINPSKYLLIQFPTAQLP